jgi:hypothetical protein
LGRGDEGRGETFEHGQLSSSFGSFSGSKAPCLWPVVPQFFRHILVGLCLHVSKVGSAPGADPKHGMHSSSVLTFSQTWHFFGSFGACWGFSSSPRFPVGFPVGSMAQRHSRPIPLAHRESLRPSREPSAHLLGILVLIRSSLEGAAPSYS